MPVIPCVLAAVLALAGDVLAERLHLGSLASTTFAVVAFGVAGVLAARAAADPRAARWAVLGGAVLSAVLTFAWTLQHKDVRFMDGAVGALLDLGFAAVAGSLGVARELRRRGRADLRAKR